MIAGYVGHGGPPLAATADILALVSADGARIRRPRRISLLNAAGNANPRRHSSTPPHGRRQNGLAPTALFVPDVIERLTPSRSHIQI
jgi:hypothetical protein